MSTHLAFLRGVNLGKRQVKSAELKEVFEGLGLANVRTLLASGNVIFEAGGDENLQRRIEEGLHQRFGFPVRAILRTREEIAVMLTSQPFAGVAADADVMRYVLLFDRPLDPLPDFPDLPAHLQVPRVDAREIYVVARRLSNGRYSEGMEKLDEHLPKGVLVTTRNWNTIEKATKK